jgi:hypothetical protein
MKIIVYIFLFLFLTPYLAFSQTDDQNLSKYWFYRYKLRKYMLKAGETEYPCADPDTHVDPIVTGFSIPAQGLDPTLGMGPHWGDATADLGWYIGTLATEYLLLKNQGANTSYTLEELYYAMKAYERVDYHSEVNLYPYDKGPCVLNGFFGRDDVSKAFGDKYFPGKVITSDYIGHNIKNASDPSKPEGLASQDQMINLMMGFALVVKCVDGAASYKGMNFVSSAKAYNDLMIGYLERHNYKMAIPYTNELANDGGIDVQLDAYGLAKAGQIVKNENWGGEIINPGNYENAISTAFRPYWINLGTPLGIETVWAIEYKHHEYQTALWQNLAAIGHSWRIGIEPTRVVHECFDIAYPCHWFTDICHENVCVDVWCYRKPTGVMPGVIIPPLCFPFAPPTIAINTTGTVLSYTGDRFGQEFYPLLHQYLHNSGNPSIGRSRYKGFMNTAPCQGPYYLGPGTGVEGWRANNNRWSTPTLGKNGVDADGSEKWRGEYSGFDYMLLYNLFSLVDGPAAGYTNRLHRDVNGTYPKPNTLHTGSDANPLIVNAFESINISGTLNAGSSNTTNGNITLHAPEGVDVTNYSTAPGATLTIITDPFTCNSSNTGYEITAPVPEDKKPEQDTAALRKQFYESLTKDLNDEIQKNIPELNKKLEGSRYEPVDDYVKRIESESKNDKLSVYPNPGSGSCELEFRIYEETIVEFSILDLYGKEVLKPVSGKVLTAGSHKLSFDVSTLSAGTYVFKLKTDQIIRTGKFVKVNQ